MSHEVKNVMVGKNIEEVRDFLERYQPIKIDDDWFPANIITYENVFTKEEEAFNYMRNQLNEVSKNTIQLCELPQNHFAYMFNSH